MINPSPARCSLFSIPPISSAARCATYGDRKAVESALRLWAAIAAARRARATAKLERLRAEAEAAEEEERARLYAEENADELAESAKRGVAEAELKAQREMQARAASAMIRDIVEVEIVARAADEAVEKEMIRNLALNAQLRAEEVRPLAGGAKEI